MTALAVDLVEPMMRAATAATCLLVAVQFGRIRPSRFGSLSGVLFCVGIAAYTLISSPPLAQALGIVSQPLILAAVFAPAFFWWFAIALFDDGARWRPSLAAPLVLLAVLYGLCFASNAYIRNFGILGHQLAIAALFLHVLMIATRDFQNDLMDTRRRFRAGIAVILPVTGLCIAAAETWALFSPLPQWTSTLQASVLLTLSLLFSLWLTAIKPEILASPDEPQRQQPEALSAAERIELQSLKAAIAGGICLEADLTLSALAARLKLPEHRLRRLISHGLGYRNFRAFLNDHRVSEAKRILADPGSSREQIAAIAYGLGYASLAPFNRAFRQMTGMTPSEFRNQALAASVDSGNS